LVHEQVGERVVENGERRPELHGKLRNSTVSRHSVPWRHTSVPRTSSTPFICPVIPQKTYRNPRENRLTHSEPGRPFVEKLPSAEAARRFGYTPGSFRVLAHRFRQAPDRAFFLPSAREIRPNGKQNRLREQVVMLRKQNLSVYDISRGPRSPTWRMPANWISRRVSSGLALAGCSCSCRGWCPANWM